VSRLAAMRAIAALLLACGAALPDESSAGAPRYADPVLSDAEGGAAKATFKPDTPKIFLHTKLADVASGSRLRANWVAEKTQVAPPNYKIDSVELKVGPGMDTARFSMTKPNAGWPEGDYRVDLLIDDKPATQAKFKVSK
jgi:hypothetical protein